MNCIKFGNKKSFEITNFILKNEIISKIENTFNIVIEYIRYNFLDKNRINELKTWNTIFTYNTFGHKFLIFITKNNDKNTVFFINRKTKQVIMSKMIFNNDLYNDTVIEAEMININNQWYLFASDILLLNGKNMISEPFSIRHNLLNDIINNKYKSDFDIEPAKILLKDFFKPSEIKSFMDDYVPTLPFKINGFLFKCLDVKGYDILYIFPECKNRKNNSDSPPKVEEEIKEEVKLPIKKELPKVNPKLRIEKRNCIFKMIVTDLPDVYELHCRQGGNIVHFNYASIPNLESSMRIQEWIDEENEEMMIEAQYIEKLKKWEPIKMLSKNVDNNKLDYINIIEQIQELY